MPRFLDMRLEPYLLGAAVSGILAQRLVRRICRACKEPLATSPLMGRLFSAPPPETLYRGRGCEECRGTGFRGRLGIYELLAITNGVRDLVFERAPETRLLEAARQHGLTSLREECLAWVRRGETTLEEVVRVTHERI